MKKILLAALFAFFAAIESYAQTGTLIDGSRFYALPPKSVEVKLVDCPKSYQDFMGTWTGDFQAYDQKTKAFRPFRNQIVYDGNCYENVKTGEQFVVGERTDTYPEYGGLPTKIETSMLITGMTGSAIRKPFLRAIDKENGLIEYQKVFEDKGLEMSIWEFQPKQKENQSPMRFRILDFRNPLNEKKLERLVFVSLRVGNAEAPYFEGVVVKGSHSQEKRRK